MSFFFFFFLINYESYIKLVVHGKRGVITISVNTLGQRDKTQGALGRKGRLTFDFLSIEQAIGPWDEIFYRWLLLVSCCLSIRGPSCKTVEEPPFMSLCVGRWEVSVEKLLF